MFVLIRHRSQIPVLDHHFHSTDSNECIPMISPRQLSVMKMIRLLGHTTPAVAFELMLAQMSCIPMVGPIMQSVCTRKNTGIPVSLPVVSLNKRNLEGF
jgi:hypothetical protein